MDGVGTFVVQQTEPGGRLGIFLGEVLTGPNRIARTNNSGNGDALRLLIYPDDGLTIPVVLAQNNDGRVGCTFHTARDLGTGGTDITLDRRLARNLEMYFPGLCGTDFIPDDGSRS